MAANASAAIVISCIKTVATLIDRCQALGIIIPSLLTNALVIIQGSQCVQRLQRTKEEATLVVMTEGA